MSSEKPKTHYRRDYAEPDYWIDTVDLDFDLGEDETLVTARSPCVGMRRSAGDAPPLVLHGEALELLEVAIDGEALPASRYHTTDLDLTIDGVPARFALRTRVRIKPQENTALSGLYRSGSMFCTQCEAMGFRRITYFLDRPDVMAVYSTTITADATRYPVLLSNGNRVHAETLEDGRRHGCAGRIPSPSPATCSRSSPATCAVTPAASRPRRARGRLEIWVEPQNIEKCEHALRSLQRAMKWDEEVFGLEYDLDIYMIVAVDDFNMGAMENKGLNVFNSKYVLAEARYRDRRRLRGHRGRDRPRVLPQLDRQPRDLPRLVPADPEGGPDGLPRPTVHRRHDQRTGQAHRRREPAAGSPVSRRFRADGASDPSRVLHLDGQLLYARPSTTRAPR